MKTAIILAILVAVIVLYVDYSLKPRGKHRKDG